MLDVSKKQKWDFPAIDCKINLLHFFLLVFGLFTLSDTINLCRMSLNVLPTNICCNWKRNEFTVLLVCRSCTFLIWLTMFTIGIVLSIKMGFFLCFYHVDVPRIVDWQFTFMYLVTKQQICAIIYITFASSNVQNGGLIALLILWFMDFTYNNETCKIALFFLLNVLGLVLFASQDNTRWLQYNSRLYSLLCQLMFILFYKLIASS